MGNTGGYDFCSEAYAVEQAIEVVVIIGEEPGTIRIDALHDLKTGRYSTRAYREEHVTLQPTYPQSGEKFVRHPEEMRIWVDFDLPWTDRDTAEGAIRQPWDS